MYTITVHGRTSRFALVSTSVFSLGIGCSLSPANPLNRHASSRTHHSSTLHNVGSRWIEHKREFAFVQRGSSTGARTKAGGDKPAPSGDSFPVGSASS